MEKLDLGKCDTCSKDLSIYDHLNVIKVKCLNCEDCSIMCQLCKKNGCICGGKLMNLGEIKKCILFEL